jgi:hypothetical protein
LEETFSRLRDPNLDIYSISRELATFGRSAIVELIRLAQESTPPMNVKAAILVGIIVVTKERSYWRNCFAESQALR